jgi:hypothetical protein
MEPTLPKQEAATESSGLLWPMVISSAATALVCAVIAIGVFLLWSDSKNQELQEARDDAAQARKEFNDLKDSFEKKQSDAARDKSLDDKGPLDDQDKMEREKKYVERTIQDVGRLEKAVGVFAKLYQTLPTTLQQLVESQNGDEPILEKRAIVDPWDQPYHYDPEMRHPDTGAPLIWSDGPPGKEKPISNW